MLSYVENCVHALSASPHANSLLFPICFFDVLSLGDSLYFLYNFWIGNRLLCEVFFSFFSPFPNNKLCRSPFFVLSHPLNPRIDVSLLRAISLGRSLASLTPSLSSFLLVGSLRFGSIP